MRTARLGNLDWSSVYMLEHRPGGTGQVLVYADAPDVLPGHAAAKLSMPAEVALALQMAQRDSAFDRFGDYWINLRKLRHTRDGSTALLSFGLSGGRIATVQAPADVLELIRSSRGTHTARKAPGRREAAVFA